VIQQGYKEWIDNPTRKKSRELDFGVWWVLFPDRPASQLVSVDGQPVTVIHMQARWRVSWIRDTGELYAKHLLPNSDQFIILGNYETEAQVEKRMEGWAGKAHALVDFFPFLYMCERYKAELVRLYGQACVDASIVEQQPDSTYLVAVAVQRSGRFELDEEPREHTLAQMQQMLTELGKRKPPPPSAKVQPLTRQQQSAARAAALSVLSHAKGG
jgi:hypothetical protein